MLKRSNCKLSIRPHHHRNLCTDSFPHASISTNSAVAPKHYDCAKKQLRKGVQIQLGGKVHASRIRARICSLLYLVGKMKKSCERVLLAIPGAVQHGDPTAKNKLPPNIDDARASISCSIPRNSCSPEAVADCIEFLKKSSSHDHELQS